MVANIVVALTFDTQDVEVAFTKWKNFTMEIFSKKAGIKIWLTRFKAFKHSKKKHFPDYPAGHRTITFFVNFITE